jgi:hypothetical protein
MRALALMLGISLVYCVGCRSDDRQARSLSAAEATSSTALASVSDSIPVEGVYSDVEYIEDAGDVVGTEIVVRRAGAELLASFQRAEGSPLMRHTVLATVNGLELRFTLPPDSGVQVRGDSRTPVQLSPAQTFVGHVTRWGLIGRIEGGPDTLALPRKPRAYFDEQL